MSLVGVGPKLSHRTLSSLWEHETSPRAGRLGLSKASTVLH